MKDRLGRTIDYMRISVTDRCNLRCRYCMPEAYCPAESTRLLRDEEILDIAKAGVSLGIVHYRITGGEPLVRPGCAELIGRLRSLPGVESVGMTTNGVLLAGCMDELRSAGLDSLNISLDTVDRAEFCTLTGRDELLRVFAGIRAAKLSGLSVKLNAVNRRELDWHSLLEYGEQMEVPVRFIEMMPVGRGKQYTGLSNRELIGEIEQVYGKAVISSGENGRGPAVYLKFAGRRDAVGFISAVHGKFCSGCNRVRLTPEGQLKLCLCYEDGIDLRQMLRRENSPPDSRIGRLAQAMKAAIWEKPEEHCFEHPERMTEHKEMSRIGG